MTTGPTISPGTVAELNLDRLPALAVELVVSAVEPPTQGHGYATSRFERCRLKPLAPVAFSFGPAVGDPSHDEQEIRRAPGESPEDVGEPMGVEIQAAICNSADHENTATGPHPPPEGALHKRPEEIDEDSVKDDRSQDVTTWESVPGEAGARPSDNPLGESFHDKGSPCDSRNAQRQARVAASEKEKRADVERNQHIAGPEGREDTHGTFEGRMPFALDN